MQTIKAQRTRLRQLAYQIGSHGEQVRMGYTVVAWCTDAPRVLDRAGSYGQVRVPWKHPLCV